MSEEGRSQQLLPVEPKGAQQLDTSSTDMGIKLKVRGPRREERIINLCDTEEQLRSITVLQLEEKIREEFNIDGAFILTHHGKWLLEESALLSHYGIRHMSEIFVGFLRFELCGGWDEEEEGTGGMGDKDGKNRSMDRLDLFNAPE